MEQTDPKKTGRGSVPAWLVLVLCVVIVLMALMICFLVLHSRGVIRCGSDEAPEAGATPAAVLPTPEQQPDPQPEPDPGTKEPAPEPAAVPTKEPTEMPELPTDVNEVPTEAPELPTEAPTAEPAAVPVDEPTPEPTAVPTEAPTEAPTAEPTAVPTSEPTAVPTPEPTAVPTPEPTAVPTPEPTAVPTPVPTAVPTPVPTAVPTPVPTAVPTAAPTAVPTPTPVPDYFMFGGVQVKTGSTKIDGDKLGISGKKKNLKYIPPKEVEDLVLLCPDLEELILDYCYMDDYAPLGSLVKLTTLQLSRCGEGGGNAIVDIGWIENLTALKTLKLHYNKIDDTNALAALTKLTYLNLGSNRLEDADLKPLSKLTGLETLYLYDQKKITDVSPLSKLTKLSYLDVGRNSKLKSVKSLTSLKKLKYLRVNDTAFSDLSYIGKFAALKKLDISNCPINEDTVWYLPECKKLETIVLDPTDNDIYWAILDGPIGPTWDVHLVFKW